MRYLITFLLLSAAASCKTYYVTPASLKQQLDNIDPVRARTAYNPKADLIDKTLNGGLVFHNDIDTIDVTDKSGKAYRLPVTSHMGIRMTDTTGKSVIVYFDTMVMKDSLVFASKSHFMNVPIHRNFYSLRKVEVQK